MHKFFRGHYNYKAASELVAILCSNHYYFLVQWQKGCAVNRLIKFALVGFFFASSAEANGFGINVNFGAAFSKLGNKQIVTPITDIEKSYTATNSAQTKYFAGGGVEYVFNDMLQKRISFLLVFMKKSFFYLVILKRKTRCY